MGWKGSPLSTKKFGAITNAHKMDLKGPWLGAIEPIFDDADSSMPGLVRDLLSLEPELPRKDRGSWWDRVRRFLRFAPTPRQPTLTSRLMPVSLTGPQRDVLGEGMASLAVRSPAFRHRLRTTTNHYRDRFGLPPIDERESTLIAGNISSHYPQLVQGLQHGKIVLLFAGDGEFAMGEGHLTDLEGSSAQSTYRCLVALTPELTVLAFRTLQYPVYPEVLSCVLGASEIEEINHITQVYTKDYLFYRSNRPAVIEAFERREFLRFEYDSHPFIEELIATVLNWQASTV